jgi:N-acetylglucosamine kinase-like BadF-type ATPase
MKRVVAFGENLKKYRKKEGLTQKELAEKLGYTEKSVSKWESGNGLPTVEVLLMLADLFHISMDELLLEQTARHYFLGIDGGGTKTLFKLVDEQSEVLNTVCKGASNPNDIGMDNTMALLTEGIKEVCHGIPCSQITIFAGLSGGGLTSDNAKILNRYFGKFGFETYDNGSDVENLVALSDYEKCVLVIMGTGFIAYALNGEERKRISGWGQIFEEGGSGFSLGRDGLIAVFNDIDGVGEKTLLTEYITQRLGKNPKDARGELCKQTPDYIGGFAALVSKAYKNGDKAAVNIVQKNMESILRFVKRARQELAEEKPKAAFVGGIFQDEIYREYIADKIGKEYRLVFTQVPPVCGALRQAACLAGENVDTAFMDNVEKTVKE